MAEQSTLANSSIKRQQPKQAVVEQESKAEPQIPSQLEHYAFAVGAFKDDPMLDAMIANIRENKEKMNANDNIR